MPNSELNKYWGQLKESEYSRSACYDYLQKSIDHIKQDSSNTHITAQYITRLLFVDKLAYDPVIEAIASYAGMLEVPKIPKNRRTEYIEKIAQLTNELKDE